MLCRSYRVPLHVVAAAYTKVRLCHMHVKDCLKSDTAQNEGIDNTAWAYSSEWNIQLTCGNCKPYLHIIAALRTMAIGLALS